MNFHALPHKEPILCMTEPAIDPPGMELSKLATWFTAPPCDELDLSDLKPTIQTQIKSSCGHSCNLDIYEHEPIHENIFTVILGMRLLPETNKTAKGHLATKGIVKHNRIIK